VRAGTNGLFYYSGLAFNRDKDTIQGGSAIFLARYVDDNNLQGANTVRYLDTHIIASYSDSATPAYFADKPFMAVDMPRGSGSCSIPSSSSVPAAIIPAGRIYIAYTLFNGGEGSKQSSIMLTYSSDCGVTWTAPQKVSGAAQTNQGATLAIDPKNGNVYVVWRVFQGGGYPDEIAGVALQYGTSNFTPILQMPISPFDQGTSGVSFRTNAYPSISVDNSEHLYIAWSQRGSTTDMATQGDARIQLLTMTGVPSFGGKTSSSSGLSTSKVITVDPYAGRGHQIMPALAFSSGKLTVAWYDFRNDDQVAAYTVGGVDGYTSQEESPVVGMTTVKPQFTSQVVDPSNPTTGEWRQTVDIRAAQASPSSPPQFSPSVLVSEYTFGTPSGTTYSLPSDPDNIQQLEFDAPNLPLFAQGTAPFVGDYIDVAGPTFIYDSTEKAWRFNNLPGDPDHTHVVWTDNRNVIPPADGNWANFTPPIGLQSTGTSIFDPTQTLMACDTRYTSDRNQDIFTATLTPGVVMSARGNFKQLSTTLTREFPVTVENPTTQTVYFQLTIQSQPPGGFASFVQSPPKKSSSASTQITIGIPPLSSASRSVFATSSNPSAAVVVNAVQTSANNKAVSGALTSTVTLNSDPSNPFLSNTNITTAEVYTPSIANPSIANPDIANPDIANPSIANPDIANPSIANVTIANPDIANPSIANPSIANPDIANPDIANPDIANPDIANAALPAGTTDANYQVTNLGNTSAAYTVNLVQNGTLPSGVTVQLIVSGVYYTPIANGCALAEEAHYIPIVNITNPLQSASAALAPSFSLEPGQLAMVTIRVYAASTGVAATALGALAPVVASQGVNVSVVPLAIVTTSLPNGSPSATATYYATVQATGGTLPYTWTVTGLPLNLTATKDSLDPTLLDLNSTGPFADASQIFTITFTVTDAKGATAQQVLTITVIGG
jgi:hypothetical protein